MIQLEYTANNIITFGKYKIAEGVNQIERKDFIELMKLPNFSYRVNNNIFKVDELEVLLNEVYSNKSFDDRLIELNETSEDLKQNTFIKNEYENYSESKKCEFVNCCHDLDLLHVLLNLDQKPRVRSYTYERIKLLEQG
jgi:hypothetical protein